MSRVQINGVSGNVIADTLVLRDKLIMGNSIEAAFPGIPVQVKAPMDFQKPVMFKDTVTFTGETIISGNAANQIRTFNELRHNLPNDPTTLGSSTAPQAKVYPNMPSQAGNAFANNLKLEYNSNANKYSLPGLKVTGTFDIVPSSDEAGAMDSEITGAGFDQPPINWSRSLASQWYGITQDDDNFYYSTWGGGLFGALFGFGTSTIFVCRKKSDASLVWVRNVKDYSLDIPTQATYLGSSNRLARVALAVHNNRLYCTTLLTNIGPQLMCLDKTNGNPIWTMAYDLPTPLAIAVSATYLVSPAIPLNSFDGSPYVGTSTSLGDLNVTVAELDAGSVSVFVGVSSFQNAANTTSITGYPTYTDTGKLIRIDDVGTTAVKVWETHTCAPRLVVGDVISTTGPAIRNPFRPTTTEVLIWRDTTSTGTFNAAGGVYGKVLDYLGVNPGYIPVGYPALNNNTMPILSNVFLVGGNPPLTESSVQNVWRSPAPGIGAGPNIYQNDNPASAPDTITNRLIAWNTVQAGLSPGQIVKIVIWAYLSQVQVTAIDGAAWGASNANVRYIAALPDNYMIVNSQEADALNYYGNSVWGNAPCLDVENNLIYFGSGQTHSCPADEQLFYNNPAIAYLDRKQPVVNAIYQYGRIDSSTNLAPYSTLVDVKNAKDTFALTTQTLSVQYNDRSPRGNMSYCDSILCADLTTGQLQFGFRCEPWDAVTFLADDPSILVTQSGYLDGDASSGIMYFKTSPDAIGGVRRILATQHKGSVFVTLDITGLRSDVVFDHTNLTAKGVIPKISYSGPDGVLGGSNFGHTQDGGTRVIFGAANNAANLGTKSKIYTSGYYKGYEYHVTRDGRVFPVRDSCVIAYDVTNNEIAWETEIGEASHAVLGCYNGVAFVGRGDGMLIGIDISSGEIIWKFDANSAYGCAGISTPSWSNGQAVWIDNYPLPFGGTQSVMGSTGLLLNVDEDLLLTSNTTIDVVASKIFSSFDITPKAPGVDVTSPLDNNQSVTHTWGPVVNGTVALEANHVFNSIPYTLNFTALEYIVATQEIIFSNYVSQSGFRYVSLKLMTNKRYVLTYQHLESGNWVTYKADCELTGLVPMMVPNLHMNAKMKSTLLPDSNLKSTPEDVLVGVNKARYDSLKKKNLI